MTFGPIFWRERVVSARRVSTYVGRALSVGVLLGAVAAVELCATVYEWDRASVGGQNLYAIRMFCLLVGVSLLPALIAVPMVIAPGIATERDKKSLDALLITRLSGAEIVTGKLAAGIFTAMAGTFAGLPVMALVVFVWGVDPRLALLTYAALAATAFVTGALAVWVSTRSRNARRALRVTLLLIIGWFYAPFLVSLVLPRLWPALSPWVTPFAWRLLDTNPMGLLAHLIGLRRVGTLVEAVWRTIAWETAGGLVLLVWASLRLRANCRAAEDREGRRWLRRLRRLTAPRRPPCGDDPVLWYEKYNTRGVGPFMRRFGQLVGAVILCGLAVLVSWFAIPAFLELFERGYGAASVGTDRPELSPFVRVLVGLRTTTPAVPPGLARTEFNTVLKFITALGLMMFTFVLAGLASESVASERVRDTLPGLLATPLTGREIVRAKMLGTVWRVRGWPILLASLWSLGLLSGALHPLGFLASLLGLVLMLWCYTAFGTYVSIWAADLKQATNRVAVPVTLTVFSGLLPIVMPARSTSVLWGAASPVWHSYFSLVTYEDVRDAFQGGPYPPLAMVGVNSDEGGGRVVATCLIGWTAQAVVAGFFTWGALRRFDKAVDRPRRVDRTAEVVPRPVGLPLPAE